MPAPLDKECADAVEALLRAGASAPGVIRALAERFPKLNEQRVRYEAHRLNIILLPSRKKGQVAVGAGRQKGHTREYLAKVKLAKQLSAMASKPSLSEVGRTIGQILGIPPVSKEGVRKMLLVSDDAKPVD